jgi:hypothetical protein
MKQAIAKHAKVICITSGGKIKELAEEHNFDTIIIPGGKPPRSCIGYSLVQLLKIIQFNGFTKTNLLEQVSASIALLNKEKEGIKNESTTIAKLLVDKLTVIYSLGTCEGVAVRFRQQINENSKIINIKNSINNLLNDCKQKIEAFRKAKPSSEPDKLPICNKKFAPEYGEVYEEMDVLATAKLYEVPGYEDVKR